MAAKRSYSIFDELNSSSYCIFIVIHRIICASWVTVIVLIYIHHGIPIKILPSSFFYLVHIPRTILSDTLTSTKGVRLPLCHNLFLCRGGGYATSLFVKNIYSTIYNFISHVMMKGAVFEFGSLCVVYAGTHSCAALFSRGSSGQLCWTADQVEYTSCFEIHNFLLYQEMAPALNTFLARGYYFKDNRGCIFVVKSYAVWIAQ